MNDLREFTSSETLTLLDFSCKLLFIKNIPAKTLARFEDVVGFPFIFIPLRS